MLLFSTMLSITDKLTPDRFIELVIDWNNESKYQENIIPDIKWNGEHNIRFGNENLWMEILEYADGDILAVRYEKKADGRIWDSDYVVNFRERKICIRLDRSYADEALITDPSFSTPHILTLLIDRGYLKDDYGLDVLRTPVTVTEDDVSWLTTVFRGKKEYHLPIVYVSKKRSGQPAVDVSWLAARLKGAAHVLVADVRKCDTVFREQCHKKVEIAGGIGIYYLSTYKRHKHFSSERYDKRPDLLLDRVVNHVISYAKLQKVDELYTYGGVLQAVLEERVQQSREERLRIEEEKRKAISESKEAKDEADDLLASVDEEIASLESQVEQYKNQVEALQAENNGLREKMNGLTSMPLLFMGDEADLYDGEIKDIVVGILKEARKGVPDRTRRADILNDIIGANGYKGYSEERSKRIKDMFKGYRNLSGSKRKELESMGMEISEDGSHYKIKYYGDDRYATSLAKSGSDHREGENIAHQIIKGMF